MPVLPGRYRGRKEGYLRSHLPGALYADVQTELSAPHVPGTTGRHPLPEKSEWIARARRWGIGQALQVVAYDDAGGLFAARLWWMLRWIGHEHVAVLDGGWQAWNAEGLPVTAVVPAEPSPSSTEYEALPSLTRSIDAGAIDASRQCLLDAREPARFRGETEPLDSVAGHIPGARCCPASGNLDAAGFFKPKDALRRKFEAVIGEICRGDVVCYCGSGITAAHNVLAMRHAGLDEPLLYAGSWSDWITDPARAIATGD